MPFIFYRKRKAIKPVPTIKRVMASFTLLCFWVSIFKLCNFFLSTGSCRISGITALDTSSVITSNFLRLLFKSLFRPIFMPVLLTKILLLYPFLIAMLNFKLLESMYMPMPTEKSTFDNACYNTPWYLSISILIEQSSFISALSVLLKIF